MRKWRRSEGGTPVNQNDSVRTKEGEESEGGGAPSFEALTVFVNQR